MQKDTTHIDKKCEEMMETIFKFFQDNDFDKIDVLTFTGAFFTTVFSSLNTPIDLFNSSVDSLKEEYREVYEASENYEASRTQQ